MLMVIGRVAVVVSLVVVRVLLMVVGRVAVVVSVVVVEVVGV